MSTQGNRNPFNLSRFVEAQERIYPAALGELRGGRKRTHWMWFIFPQLDGLGYSSTAKYYAIKGGEEAEAYLNHPLLGTRLRECSEAVLGVEGRSVSEIFGYPDDLKLHSSMTLFAEIAGPQSIFAAVLEKFFAGKKDAQTLRLL